MSKNLKLWQCFRYQSLHSLHRVKKLKIFKFIFWPLLLKTDNWALERLYATEVPGRVSGRLSRDGADGRESLSSNPNGSGSRAYVLSPLPNALWHQTFAFGWDYTQSKCILFLTNIYKRKHTLWNTRKFVFIYRQVYSSNFTGATYFLPDFLIFTYFFEINLYILTIFWHCCTGFCCCVDLPSFGWQIFNFSYQKWKLLYFD